MLSQFPVGTKLPTLDSGQFPVINYVIERIWQWASNLHESSFDLWREYECTSCSWMARTSLCSLWSHPGTRWSQLCVAGASMALDSKPFSNPGLDEPEPIVLHSPEAFNFQPYSLTILCSAYLKVIATVPTIENSKAAAAGSAFYLCRAGSKAAVERGARKRNAKTIPSVSFIRSPLVVSFAPLSSAATALSPFTFAGGNRAGSQRTKHIAIYGRNLWL